MNLLLVEDDPPLAELLERVFREEGVTSETCTSLAAARVRIFERAFDAIVLDWMLPDGEGIVLCAELKAAHVTTPILMLTARGEVQDRVSGLRAGADDYLVKPFDVDELLARLDALLRRGHRSFSVRVGALEVDYLARRAVLDGTELVLTAREFDLLAHLTAEADRIVSREALLARVWRLDFDPGSGVLDVHMSRLREKLGEHAWMIQTVRGVGYRFRRRASA